MTAVTEKATDNRDYNCDTVSNNNALDKIMNLVSLHLPTIPYTRSRHGRRLLAILVHLQAETLSISCPSHSQTHLSSITDIPVVIVALHTKGPCC